MNENKPDEKKPDEKKHMTVNKLIAYSVVLHSEL